MKYVQQFGLLETNGKSNYFVPTVEIKEIIVAYKRL